MRRAILDGQSVASAWQDGSLPWLIVHSGFFLLAGWTAFVYCEHTAKKQGSLGQH